MPKIISFNLSTAAIMQEIYAISALRSMKNNVNTPPILTRDQQGALRKLIKDAFAFIVMKFISHVEGCNLNNENENGVVDDSDSEDMILSVDVRLCDDITNSITGVMRIILEHSIAAYALHICYIGHDDYSSKHYGEIAQTEMAQFKQLLVTNQFNTMSITPHYL